MNSIDNQDSEDKASLFDLVDSFSNEILSLRTGMFGYRSFHEGVVQDLDHAVRGFTIITAGYFISTFLKDPFGIHGN